MTSRAQKIADKILGSDRFAQSSAFADRVFTDEPILRTGTSALKAKERDSQQPRRGDAVADQSSAPRPSRHGSATDYGITTPSEAASARSAMAPNGAATAHGATASSEAPTLGRDRTPSPTRPGPQATARRPQPTSSTIDGLAELLGIVDNRNTPANFKTPKRYRDMRRLQHEIKKNGYHQKLSGAHLFYEQAMFMKDFEDDFDGTCVVSSYYPSYDKLSNYELRCYISWRTHYRGGEVPDGPIAFLFLLAYELLCGVGVEPGREGLLALQKLAVDYEGRSDAFDSSIARWIHDYAVFHNITDVYVPSFLGSFATKAILTLRKAQAALLELGAKPEWPAKPVEGMPSPEVLLDALAEVSRYRAERSRFFKAHRADAAEVTSQVFACMVAHCHKRRKTDYVEGLFGEPVQYGYSMFSGAIFWSPKPHPDAVVELGDDEVYECRRGFWWRRVPCRRVETSRELGNLLHAIDCRMRDTLGDAHPLKPKSLPKYQAKFVDEKIAALVARREAEEAARVTIDRKALRGIRSASVRTREALLTEEERGEDNTDGLFAGTLQEFAQAHTSPEPVPATSTAPANPTTSANTGSALEQPEPSPDAAPEPSAPTSPAPTPASPAASASASADSASALGLDATQLAVLEALLAGQPVAEVAGGPFLSLAVDAINEAFLDVVGDTVIEFEEDNPVLIEDYEQDVREALA